MKKTKVIIPALGILLLSTAASVTGTVAWFSQNQNVYANDIKVKAKAETGLVISKTAANSGFDSEVSFSTDEVKALFPTSTSDFVTWYHNNSKDPSTATGAANVGTYTTDGAENTHFIKKQVWIRSSSNVAIDKALTVAAVNITKTQNLSKAIRVGVWFEGAASNNKFIYRASDTATASYAVGGDAENTVTALAPTVVSTSGLTQVPSNQNDGTSVLIYLWFEGEDANCISDYIEATLEDVAVSVTFSTAA